MMRWLAVAAWAWVSCAAALEAPNVVMISDRLATSGQPKAASLAELGREGYTKVIYLVPPGAPDAVADEAKILRAQGIEFVVVPIAWERPSDADFDAFAAAMGKADAGKVLVHCQINLRASTMTFLYRTVVLGVPPDKAYEAVTAVWSPNAVWKRYATAQLARAGIAFEPY
ncbi:MAG: protein tyrosine phosphatase family protein [Burkholderiales bacterium]